MGEGGKKTNVAALEKFYCQREEWSETVTLKGYMCIYVYTYMYM